jgi:competence protein ComEC
VRKLANACIAFALAVFLSHYAVPEAYIPAAAAVCAAAGLISRRAGIRRGVRFPLVFFAMALGFGCCWLQNSTTIKNSDALAGREMNVHAVVTDFPTSSDGFTSVYIKLEQDGIPRVSARLYDYEGYLPALSPGDEIILPVRFKSATQRYGEETDFYTARRVFAICTAVGGCEISGGSRALYFPKYAALWVKNAVEEAFPADTAPFLKALLMGDKSDFYDQGEQYVAMRTSGLIHVVAVSGLHVAFLVSFIQLIMGASRRSSVICLVLVWFFVIMTGAGPSTVRAGFMQSLLLTAPLFGRENDGLTSLSLPLAVILFLNPAEAGSAALQMSFGAMAGMMSIAPAVYGRLVPEDGRASRLRRYAAGVVSSSLGATVFTVPILALRFGYVPMLGPIANLLCLWAVTLCFCGGFAVCALFALFHPLGAAGGWLVSWLARYIFAITGLISRVPYAAVYTNNRLSALWLILTYALFILTWFGRGRGEKYRWYVPAGISAACLASALIAVSAVYSSGAGYFTAIDVGQGQSLAVMSGERTVVVDCGGRSSGGNAGETAAAYLLGCGRRSVDELVLTHLHEDHTNGAVRLMQMMPVKELVLPLNASDDDGMLPEIIAQARKGGTNVKYIASDTAISAGGINISLYAPPEKGTENERGLSMTVSVGGFDMLVTGDMNRTAEKELISTRDLSGTELLIAGHHGSANSSSAELLAETGAKTAIISVGYNTYGHPTNAALTRLYNAGAAVYRTDLNGNVTVRAS